MERSDLDAGRLSMLYRLCIPAEACRVLEVNGASAPVLRGENWAGSTVVNFSMGSTAELPFPEGEFDAVVLHRALDELIARGRLSRLCRLLAPGGTIAGCVARRHNLRSALGAAGLGDVRLFSVVPDLDSPRKLLTIEEGWSRRASKRQLEALRPMLSRWGYVAWRVLAEAGVSQYLGRAILFSGRRAC